MNSFEISVELILTGWLQGFRLGGDEKLKNEIRDMVMKLIQPRNRIIVCLEQSTGISCRPHVAFMLPYVAIMLPCCTFYYRVFDSQLTLFQLNGQTQFLDPLLEKSIQCLKEQVIHCSFILLIIF